MSGNTIGRSFCVTTFGESHGPAIGAVVDGCPPGLELAESDIQADLEPRRTGTSQFTSQRLEPDAVRILSGVFEGRTTGTSIGLLVDNVDARGRDYEKIKDRFRPGHADYAYQQKYGIRDYRGVDANAARTNPFHCADPQKLPLLESFIRDLRRDGDSVGARVTVIASRVPPGLGEPMFDRLDADIAFAMMGINAAKAVEIGDGVAVAGQRGTAHRDELTPRGFASNHGGGTLGGISSGQDLVVHVSFKPTSSIPTPGRTIDVAGQATDIATTGRHDPCVGLRAVPIVEAMLLLVLMDHVLRHRGQCADVASATPDITR